MLLASRPPQTHSSRVQPQPAGLNLFRDEERFSFVRQFGSHLLSFTALQSGMEYFDIPGVGFLAFRRKWGKCIVLGDPVADEAGQETLLTTFLRTNPRASFVQVSQRTARMVHDRFGLYGTQFGQEMNIDLQNWSLAGKNRDVIRRARNRAKAAGIQVRESGEELDAETITQKWRKTRAVSKREIQFLIRPRNMTGTSGTRYFYAFRDDIPIAFVYLDPIFDRGRIVSYVPNISCACEEFRQGIFYVIMSHAMLVLQQEGLRSVSLGLVPFLLDESKESFECQHVRNVIGKLYRRCPFYNFAGIHFTKKRFGGDLTRTFFCHHRTAPLLDAARILKLTRVI